MSIFRGVFVTLVFCMLASCASLIEDQDRFELGEPKREASHNERIQEPVAVERIPADRPTGRSLLAPVTRGADVESELRARDEEGAAALVDDGPRTITMTLSNVPVREFAAAVFSDVLQTNYVIAPNAEGSVTLEIIEPVSKRGLLELATEALKISGFSLRVGNGAFLIESAGARGAQTASETRTIRLLHATGDQLRQTLQPLLGPDVRLSIGPNGKSVILYGSLDRLDAVERLIVAVDEAAAEGGVFALIPLENSEASTMSQELAQFLATAPGQTPRARVIAIPRLNAVVIASENASQLSELKAWAAILDSPTPSSGDDIFIYPARNRPAAELAQLTRALFSKDASGGDVRAAGAQGAASTISAVQATGSDVDVRILVDPGRNSLIISGDSDDFRVVQRALDRLDRPKRQVKIEASIVEVVLNDELRYGVRWFLEGRRQGDTLGVSLSDLEDGAISATFPGFSAVLDAADARVVVDALSSVTDVKVVSSPTLLALDGEKARMLVGDQVPVVTRAASSVSDTDAPIINQVEFKDTGVILEIEPEIYADGLVKLKVNQEVSDVVPTTSSGIDNPTIQQRTVSSTLTLRRGETVLLGGLSRERATQGKSGVPVLSEIPILGEVFKSSEEASAKTELLVTLRPVF